MYRPCTFGIEEEYLLAVLASGRLLTSPSPAVARRCRDAAGQYFVEEMFRSQIEIASPIFGNLHEACEFFQEYRHRLNASLAEEGVGLYCASSHPNAPWLRQKARPSPHYRQVFDDYQLVARRSLLNGLHVHVGVPPGCDRMQLINRLLYWLPLLLVLSTSSPFWGGEDTGYMSYRRVICGEWPHMGLPEALPDWAAYERYRALLQRTGALAKDGDFWWAIRPARRFPTVELRICDACPDLEDALCVAGLFRYLVEHNLQPRYDPMPLGRELRWITQENYWRAMRHGRFAEFIGLHDQQPVTAQGWLSQLQARHAVDTVDAERACQQAQLILQAGTSADHQRQVRARALADGATAARALQAVAAQVLAQGRGEPVTAQTSAGLAIR